MPFKRRIYYGLCTIDCSLINRSAKPVDDSEAGAATEMVEVEEKVMTLDEYRALEEARRVKAEFNIRKPGEGCTDEKWKKMFVLKKKLEEPEEEEEEEV